MKLEDASETDLIDIIERAEWGEWAKLGQRTGKYARYAPSPNPFGIQVIIPLDPTASDYPEMMNTAVRVLQWLISAGTALSSATDAPHSSTQNGGRVDDARWMGEVLAEQDRARAKHGENSIVCMGGDDPRWLSILAEELGEVAHALSYDAAADVDLAAELIQVAAVAVSWRESLRSTGPALQIPATSWTVATQRRTGTPV